MVKGAKRILVLDEIRGFAIVCMIFHHMFYDIGFVLELDWGYRVFNFLCTFQPVFWAAFILTSGICSRLSRNPVKRGIIVLAAGIAVSLVTAVIMPAMGITGAEIYFGILSCLGCSMIITGFLMPLINKGIKTIYSTHSVFITALLNQLIIFLWFRGCLCFYSAQFLANMQRKKNFPNLHIKVIQSFFSLSEKTACGFILRISLPFTQLCISSNYLYNELCRRYFGFYACIIV